MSENFYHCYIEKEIPEIDVTALHDKQITYMAGAPRIVISSDLPNIWEFLNEALKNYAKGFATEVLDITESEGK